MGFWTNTFSNFLGSFAAAVLVVSLYVLIQWFLQATDIVVGYNWSFDGTPDHPRNFRPNLDIRNRSRSRTYRLANIAYSRTGAVHSFDNTSVWGAELEPGSIHFFHEIRPVDRMNSLRDCTEMQVTVRLQNGRMFWLRGQGPGQMRSSRMQRIAFRLRDRLEAASVPME